MDLGILGLCLSGNQEFIMEVIEHVDKVDDNNDNDDNDDDDHDADEEEDSDDDDLGHQEFVMKKCYLWFI